jgi:hypothetical protein
MKAKAALTLLLTAVNASAAIQCGSYEIDGSKYATRVNGDPVRMVSHRFTAAPRADHRPALFLCVDRRSRAGEHGVRHR